MKAPGTIVLTLAALTALPATAPAQQDERHVLRGSEVAVHNLAGETRIEAGSGAEVVVELTRGGRDAGRLRVETATRGGRPTLSVVYPGSDFVYPRLRGNSRSQLRLHDDGTLGSGGRRVTITGSGRGLEAYADLRVSVPRGQRIAVHQGVGQIWVSNVDGELRVDGASTTVESEATRGTLDIDVGSGSVRVHRAEGRVSVDTGSGSVHLSEVRGTRLNVDTGSGSVTGSDLDVEELLVDVGSGRVRLSGVRARSAVVDTGSGGVELALTAPARSLRIDTGSGGVDLTVPTSLNAQLDISTGSGGISVDLPVREVESRRNRFRGTVGEGEGRVRIDTGSGGVRVRGG